MLSDLGRHPDGPFAHFHFKTGGGKPVRCVAFDGFMCGNAEDAVFDRAMGGDDAVRKGQLVRREGVCVGKLEIDFGGLRPFLRQAEQMLGGDLLFGRVDDGVRLHDERAEFAGDGDACDAVVHDQKACAMGEQQRIGA